jgi:hypothetical protein
VVVLRGLGQALGSAVVALAAAGPWTAAAGGAYPQRAGLSLLVVAALLALVGGKLLSRAGTSDTRAFLGMAPERARADPGGSLGPMGVVLFVCLPLAVAGLVLAG